MQGEEGRLLLLSAMFGGTVTVVIHVELSAVVVAVVLTLPVDTRTGSDVVISVGTAITLTNMNWWNEKQAARYVYIANVIV